MYVFESLETLALVIGPFGAFVMIPLWFGAAGRVRWRLIPRWQQTLGVSATSTFVMYWVTWWFAFDFVEGEAVPNALFPAATVLMYATAAGAIALLADLAGMLVRPRRLGVDRPS